MYTSEGKVSALHLLKSVALSSAKTPRSAVPKIISCSVISGVDVTSRLADNSFCWSTFPVCGSMTKKLLEEMIHNFPSL